MTEKNIQTEEIIDSSNIFNEFDENSNLVDEVEKLKKAKNRDSFYYISKIGAFMQIIFWILLIITIVLSSYAYIQEDSDFSNSNIIDPICNIFIGDIEKPENSTFCSSISSINKTYLEELDKKNKEINKEILKLLEGLYKGENFTKSKEVLFLSSKSNTKLKVLDILEKFNNIKNNFDVDKQKVQCYNIFIESDKNILYMDCDAYSAGFEKGLLGFDGSDFIEKKGTSISVANSFINFIDKKYYNIFSIIDRQKIFKSERVVGDKTNFTNKTKFNLKLKIK